MNKAIVRNNYNYNGVGHTSGGIIYKAYNESSILNNKNFADLNNINSGGILYKAFDSVLVNANENHGVIANDGAGIMVEVAGDCKIEDNKNYGDITANTITVAGIVNDVFGNVKINNNTNYGKITHFVPLQIGPIANFITNTVTVNNNFWLIHNGNDINLHVATFFPGFVQSNGGALTRQQMISRGLL